MGADGRRGVLVTRPVVEAEATAARLREMGWVPVLAPLMRVVRVEVAWAGRHGGVVLTSGNAVPGAAGLEGLPALAVGDATAAKAVAAGFRRVGSAGGDMAALAAAAAEWFVPGADLAYPAADGEGMALAERLAAAGFGVDRQVAYRMEPAAALPGAAADALRGDVLRAALFLSARTARVFAGVLPAGLRPCLAGVEALAIGGAAADELTPLPWRRVRVSLAPTLDQVLALL